MADGPSVGRPETWEGAMTVARTILVSTGDERERGPAPAQQHRVLAAMIQYVSILHRPVKDVRLVATLSAVQLGKVREQLTAAGCDEAADAIELVTAHEGHSLLAHWALSEKIEYYLRSQPNRGGETWIGALSLANLIMSVADEAVWQAPMSAELKAAHQRRHRDILAAFIQFASLRGEPLRSVVRFTDVDWSRMGLVRRQLHRARSTDALYALRWLSPADPELTASILSAIRCYLETSGALAVLDSPE
jgi:hypothetical protein